VSEDGDPMDEVVTTRPPLDGEGLPMDVDSDDVASLLLAHWQLADDDGGGYDQAISDIAAITNGGFRIVHAATIDDLSAELAATRAERDRLLRAFPDHHCGPVPVPGCYAHTIASTGAARHHCHGSADFTVAALSAEAPS